MASNARIECDSEKGKLEAGWACGQGGAAFVRPEPGKGLGLGGWAGCLGEVCIPKRDGVGARGGGQEEGGDKRWAGSPVRGVGVTPTPRRS